MKGPHQGGAMMIEKPPGCFFFTAVTVAAFISLWWSSVSSPYTEGLSSPRPITFTEAQGDVSPWTRC